MTSSREIALDLAANYGIPVFPCKADKSPATHRGFYDATTDLEQIESWFANGALIGVPTGEPSGIVCLDVDPDGTDWYQQHADSLACGCVNRTRRGYHLLYKRTAHVPCSTSKVAKGIDVRGDGGYIVYWPGDGLPQVGSLDDLTPFPDWVLASVATKPKEIPDAAVLPGMGAIEGSRNDYLSRQAYKMRKAGMTLPEILAALRVTNQQRCEPPLPDSEVVQIVQRKLAVEADPQPEQIIAEKAQKILLRPLAEIVAEQREPTWLLHKVLEANVLAVIAGPRGTFKSFIALDWAIRCAAEGQGVVMLSGEGAGLDRRAEAWRRIHKPGLDFASLPFVAVERPLNLRLAVELAALTEAVKGLSWKPALFVIDTFSKFSAGIDENDNGEVSAFLAGLTDFLRESFEATVLLVAHSGHGDAKRPRGASALMANPDAEYIVDRPPGMFVSVSRERFKDSPALDALSYEAKSVDLGRFDAYGEPVTSLALIGSGPPPRALKVPGGKAQKQLLTGLRNLQRDSKTRLFWTMEELRAVARSAGQNKSSARSAAEGLAMSCFIVPIAGGGYALPMEEVDGLLHKG